MSESVDRRSSVSIHLYPAFVEGLQSAAIQVLVQTALHLLSHSVQEEG
jgi:hypothetical protein